jgi:hypothetical protein
MTLLGTSKRILRRALPGRLVPALVAFLLVVGVALLLANRSALPAWLFPGLTGVGALACATAVVAFGVIFRERPGMSRERAAKHRNARARFQAIAASAMVLSLLGTLGLYRLHAVGFDYDKALHFIVPALGTHGLARFLKRHGRCTAMASTWMAVGILAFIAVTWELSEFASDLLLGTKAFGEGGETLVLDTALDLALGAGGIAFGAISARWNRERS